MYSLQRDLLFDVTLEDLIITSDKVAHVQIGNLLEHALLVLIKSGYTAVPVLDPSYRLQGIISKNIILDSMLGVERIETEKLGEYQVEEVMDTTIPRLSLGHSFIKAFGLTINHPFVCVEDENGLFAGIITRRAILKLMIRHLNYE
ncbi:cyclic-di-AMP-binding protein CbpB [Bacillus tianshenii]|nr:cyclic-di-AMP-binding protein CbpB [Bacillus tianshenii]